MSAMFSPSQGERAEAPSPGLSGQDGLLVRLGRSLAVRVALEVAEGGDAGVRALGREREHQSVALLQVEAHLGAESLAPEGRGCGGAAGRGLARARTCAHL